MKFWALALAGMVVAGPALAAPKQYGALAIDAKGARIATVEGEGHARVVLRAAADGRVLDTLDPCPVCSYSGLTFAADGALAFLARDRSAGTVTLELSQGGATRPVATVKGIAQTPRFSPDGRRIALLVTIGAAKEAGAAQAGVRQVGEIGARNDEQRLAVFERGAAALASEAISPVSPAGRYVYEYDWLPDGSGVVATTALGNGDANWWVATLDRIDIGSGAVMTIARPKLQMNFPRVSPDGRTVAFIGGVMSDFGSVGGDVWTVPLAGGAPANLTEGQKATALSLDWTDAGLRAVVLRGDQMQLAPVGAQGFGPAAYSAAVNMAAGDGRAAFSADGRHAASVIQSFTVAPAIHAGPLSALKQLTHDNDGEKPLVSARSLSWTQDGFTSQGWLLAPAGADPAQRAPMITIVHGGPAAAHLPGFVSGGTNAQLLKAGYYLFLPNPRGSYGQGEAFVAANKRDFGGGDLRDILAGIDAAEKVAPIDDARLGLMGGSYGGFMAMWANTQTNRFKAIIASAGLSNWISYYGTNGINEWMIPYFGKSVYEDYEAYKAVSAIYVIGQAKTPTFIYVGERDIEVPPTQSVEYWNGLKAHGVPTSLVIYAEEGHGIRNPANAADVQRRTLEWFGKYLGAKPQP
ncbi:prolyl oligopeptidase family serine peptidase [Sphingomonas sp.]|uniref:S9 family peptidase n=1 Tax=Sphingomonas sp. TaxID=28214 RepID=UPI001DC3FE1C|nr:prolyl oligopeptidase family serine peptidase [Sphingomonas sp.]MBX9795447.1 alpha/beta fold hydrolase [Sphingomonas sp.]